MWPRVVLDADRVIFNTTVVEAETRSLAKLAQKEMKGRIRRSGKASNPGEAPKGKRGVLRRSIGIKKLREPRIGYHVGPKKGGANDGFYGRFLEFSTKSMEERPVIRPVIDALESKMMRRLGEAAEGAVEVRK